MSWLQKVGRTLGLDPRRSAQNFKRGIESIAGSNTAKKFGGRLKDAAIKHGGGFLKDTWNTVKKRGSEFGGKALDDLSKGRVDRLGEHAAQGLKDSVVDVKDSAIRHGKDAVVDVAKAGGKAIGEGASEIAENLKNKKTTRAATKRMIRKPLPDDEEFHEL